MEREQTNVKLELINVVAFERLVSCGEEISFGVISENINFQPILTLQK